ncbi:MAG: LysE family transporter [Candidatus Pacebacteria bacterium]|nr:LysE family transporter [Candidatus Paceibacterota bacterium]
MQLMILLHGLLIGMLISIPTGPVGFLCVRRALLYPYKQSFSSAFGSIAADLIFGFIGIFSLTSISDFYVREQTPIRTIGALILLYVGIKTFFNFKSPSIPGFKENQHVGNFTSTFILTMTNPIQVITLPLVFAAVGTGIRPDNYGDMFFFMLGLAIGAAFLWVMLIGISTVLKKKIHEMHLKYINYIAGSLITATGLYILLKLVLHSW